MSEIETPSVEATRTVPVNPDLPWGLIYTPICLVTNLRGGKDVTAGIAQPPIEHSIAVAGK